MVKRREDERLKTRSDVAHRIFLQGPEKGVRDVKVDVTGRCRPRAHTAVPPDRLDRACAWSRVGTYGRRAWGVEQRQQHGCCCCCSARSPRKSNVKLRYAHHVLGARPIRAAHLLRVRGTSLCEGAAQPQLAAALHTAYYTDNSLVSHACSDYQHTSPDHEHDHGTCMGPTSNPASTSHRRARPMDGGFLSRKRGFPQYGGV